MDNCVRCGTDADLRELTRFSSDGLASEIVCTGCLTKVEAAVIGREDRELVAFCLDLYDAVDSIRLRYSGIPELI